MLFNELLGPAARFSRGLARIFQTQEGEGVRTVGPEILPTICLEHDRPEYGAIMNDRLVGVNRLKTADAANLSRVRLRNPVDSGILGVIRFLELQSSLAGTIYVFTPGAGAADLGSAARGRNHDLRLGVLQTVLVTSVDAPATFSGTNLIGFDLQAGVPRHIPVPFVLPPDTALDFFSSAINTTISVTLGWRERELASSELIA